MAIDLAPNEQTLDGLYPLGALIRRSVRSATYETEFGEGEDAVPAVIRIREVEPAEAENLTQRLWNVTELTHPNLLKIYATGSATLNDAPVFYVVMERADESLESVLSERALTADETREMLVPALDALDCLHKNGYAHSRLRPSNVLAVNDRLKLSTDSLIGVTDAAAAEDMRALGILILQALAHKIPNPDERRGSQDFDDIPQPLADIARHCLDPNPARRWTVEQAKASLSAPIIAEEKDSHSDVPKPAAPRLPKWIYPALAALILIVILLAVTRNNNSTPAAIPAQPATPAPRAEVLPEPAPPPAAPATAGRKASGWSVIAGAYRSRDLAEKRMREMTTRWPNFHISVLESHEEKTPYLVVLGTNLSEDEAKALRQRAIESRLPRDTYIKRIL